MSWSTRSFTFCLSLSLLLAIPVQAQKASCTFKTFVLNPANLNSPRENAFGVNDNGTVVGSADYPFNKPNITAFVHYADGTIKYWRPSGAPISGFSARNNAGNTNHSTGVVGINKWNTILGSYSDANGNTHDFKRYSNGTFVNIPNFPGASRTIPSAINDNGAIVGFYAINAEGPDISHGFIYHNGNWGKAELQEQNY